MAAIFGIIGASGSLNLELMSKKLIHRGSEFISKIINDDVKLGLNRSDKFSQLYNEGLKYIIGSISIYNREELIINLKSKNISLNSDSNEELLFKIYSNEGVEGLRKINGDFSFAIWDDEKKILTLGRDFFGCRPLYYIKSLNNFSFATEYKAFLTGSYSLSPNLDMVQHLQNGKRLPLGRTLTNEVSAVLPGSILEYDYNSGDKRIEMMEPLRLNVIEQSEKEISEKIINELTKAIVKRINILGTPIGIALSGGIDSIALAYLCRKAFPQAEIYTFTAGYGDDDPEVATAKKVAKNLNTKHFEVLTPPELMKKFLPELVWYMEDPYSRSEALQLFEIGRVASKYVKYLMSAQGADGLFAGMPKYKLLYYTRKFPFLKSLFIDVYNLTQIGTQPKSILGKAAHNFHFRKKIPFVPAIIGADYFPASVEFPSFGKELINRMLVKGFQTGVCQDIQKFERNFAAWGVQYTSPFYDFNLINTAYSISDKYKIVKGQEKYILRKSLMNIIPAELRNVPKLPQRMQYDLEFAMILEEVLDNYMSEEKTKERGFFDYSDIQKLRRKDLSKAYSPEGAMRIWTAILTEIWAEKFIDKKPH